MTGKTEKGKWLLGDISAGLSCWNLISLPYDLFEHTYEDGNCLIARALKNNLSRCLQRGKRGIVRDMLWTKLYKSRKIGYNEPVYQNVWTGDFWRIVGDLENMTGDIQSRVTPSAAAEISPMTVC